MGVLRAAVLGIALTLAAAAPAAAAPGILGGGTDPGVAVDAAGTAHVAWLGERSVEYCQVPRGKRKCAVRQSFGIASPGVADVQVHAPRPGLVVVFASVLNDPALLLTSTDGGTTFTGHPAGELNTVAQSVFGPGDSIALISGAAGFSRFGLDGSGPPESNVGFADATDALDNTIAPYGAGYAVFFGGAGDIGSVLWNGAGDPNLPESWVTGPALRGDRLAPAAVGGPSGTWVAYEDRRGRGSAIRVRRLRNARLGRAKRLSRDDVVNLHASQGPRGDMIVLWRPTSSVVKYVRSKTGRRWTRPRTLFRGHEPTGLRPALGRRGGWMVWGTGGTDSVIRIAALPRAPRR